MWDVLHSRENANNEIRSQKAYDRDGYSVKVECPRSVDKAYNITNWLIYSDSRARLTVVVNKQYNYIQDDNQSNKTGGISTGKKKYIAGG